MTSVLTWVVGSGGLLGANVARAATQRGSCWSPSSVIPWTQNAEPAVLAAAATEFLARSAGRPWQIAWCAGAGSVGTTAFDLDWEVQQFRAFLDTLSRLLNPRLGALGALFLASSAGGVYAGAENPPFTEETSPVPLAPYGHAKLAMEDALRRFSQTHGLRVVIGRISNLYGPGQNLAKPQGLLSQIIRAHLLRRPISIYVSLDTVRDYIFAPDCAEMALDCLDHVRRHSATPTVQVKILASQRGVTIAAILGELRRIFKRPPQMIYGASASSKFQTRDLRFRSVVLRGIDKHRMTPLPAGLSATANDISRTMRAGRL